MRENKLRKRFLVLFICSVGLISGALASAFAFQLLAPSAVSAHDDGTSRHTNYWDYTVTEEWCVSFSCVSYSSTSYRSKGPGCSVPYQTFGTCGHRNTTEVTPTGLHTRRVTKRVWAGSAPSIHYTTDFPSTAKHCADGDYGSGHPRSDQATHEALVGPGHVVRTLAHHGFCAHTHSCDSEATDAHRKIEGLHTDVRSHDHYCPHAHPPVHCSPADYASQAVTRAHADARGNYGDHEVVRSHPPVYCNHIHPPIPHCADDDYASHAATQRHKDDSAYWGTHSFYRAHGDFCGHIHRNPPPPPCVSVPVGHAGERLASGESLEHTHNNYCETHVHEVCMTAPGSHTGLRAKGLVPVVHELNVDYSAGVDGAEPYNYHAEPYCEHEHPRACDVVSDEHIAKRNIVSMSLKHSHDIGNDCEVHTHKGCVMTPGSHSDLRTNSLMRAVHWVNVDYSAGIDGAELYNYHAEPYCSHIHPRACDTILTSHSNKRNINTSDVKHYHDNNGTVLEGDEGCEPHIHVGCMDASTHSDIRIAGLVRVVHEVNGTSNEMHEGNQTNCTHTHPRACVSIALTHSSKRNINTSNVKHYHDNNGTVLEGDEGCEPHIHVGCMDASTHSDIRIAGLVRVVHEVNGTSNEMHEGNQTNCTHTHPRACVSIALTHSNKRNINTSNVEHYHDNNGTVLEGDEGCKTHIHLGCVDATPDHSSIKNNTRTDVEHEVNDNSTVLHPHELPFCTHTHESICDTITLTHLAERNPSNQTLKHNHDVSGCVKHTHHAANPPPGTRHKWFCPGQSSPNIVIDSSFYYRTFLPHFQERGCRYAGFA